ncbi:MAG: accessory gene regulator B family protein [Butyrivibrio sp.]|nr:accessory gene regulator B family protein [Muribaculum sp.]MCM1553681.1 accessory gene regulator B family protein [Butyrivibrio sp.]
MKITEYLIRTGDASESEREVLDFGFQMLGTVLISGIIVCVTGIYMGMLAEALIFVAALLPLRQYAGGLHLHTRAGCGIVSFMLLACSLLLMKYTVVPWKIQLIIYLIGALLIAVYAPVDNENNPLDSEVKDKFGRRARIIMGIESIIFILLLILRMQNQSIIIAWAIFLVGILAAMGAMNIQRTGKRSYGEDSI